MKRIFDILPSVVERTTRYGDDYTCEYYPIEQQRWDNYMDFLKSLQWNEKRNRVIKFWGNRCLMCGNDHEHIHHLNYKQRWGDEDIERDIIPLCSKCHKIEHLNFKQSIISEAKFNGDTVDFTLEELKI